MNWKKKTLLAVLGATALVGVTASASAESWSLYVSPQTTSFYGYSDGYRYNNRYDRYDSRYYYGRDYRNHYWRHHDRDGYRGYGDYRGYGWHSWNGYGNGYGQQDRGYYHHDRDDD